MSREFPLGVILSITTGRMCHERFGDIHEALDYLTGETLFTHQLPRASTAVAPALIEQHPFLADVHFPEYEVDNVRSPVEFTIDWVAAMMDRHGGTLTVEPVPDAYEPKHPIVELGEMMGRRDDE